MRRDILTARSSLHLHITAIATQMLIPLKEYVPLKAKLTCGAEPAYLLPQRIVAKGAARYLAIKRHSPPPLVLLTS